MPKRPPAGPLVARLSGPARAASLVFVPIVAASLLIAPAVAEAQGVETDLAGLAMENAERYVEPLTFGLGYAMSGGLFDTAAPMRRFGFDVGVRAMGSLPSEASRTFDAVVPEQVTYNGQTFNNPYRVRGGDPTTPTATGQGAGIVLEPGTLFRAYLLLQGEDPDDFNIAFPNGADVPVIPFMVAHASMGIGWGTELSLRVIPEIEMDEEVGALRAFGFGAKHSVSQWFPGPSPVDIAVWYGRQNVKVGDFLEGSANQYGVMAGKGFGPLTLYGTGMMRTASVGVSYTVENPDDVPGLPADGERVGFSSDLDSALIFGLGAQLRLLILNLSAQYTADDFSTLSLKVGLGRP